MITKNMQEMINKQITAELYSAYLYLSMAAYFDNKNLSGFSNWLKIQAKEELTHAMKFYDHLVDRGVSVTLTAIDAPPTKWDNALSVFEAAYEHEQKVTGMIHSLAEQAIKEKDYAAHERLLWFIKEQVEEEKSADEIVQKLRMIKDSPNGLLMLDKQLAKREFEEEDEEKD